MSFNKSMLATAVAGALYLAAGSAAAQVNISATTVTPVKYAQEITKGTGGVSLSAVLANRLQFDLGYNFSGGEVRYARVECSSNIKFGGNVAVTSSDAANMSLGAVNGAGTNAVFFSITDNTTTTPGGAGATDVLTLASSYTLADNNDVTCSYGLYDQPSQAQAGGSAGRIVFKSGTFLQSVPSYTFAVNSTNTLVADVEAANGAYTDFTAATDNVSLGAYTFGLVANAPLKADGNVITLTDLFANAAFQVAGDFAAAGTVSFTHAGAADFTINAGKTTATRTDANVVAYTGQTVFFNELGNAPMLEGDYTIRLTPAFKTGYQLVQSHSALAFGKITRNGTQLQAPLAQVPAGWLSRMVLTNTGTLARPYTISVMGETGNNITTDNLTGSVPANGTIVVDLTTVLKGFSASPRATLNVTVAGPNNQIQGLYQLVNTSNLSATNHVMVRPGSN